MWYNYRIIYMENTINSIKEFAKTILHCGDYGQTYFNPKTGVVHWVGGDSDGGFEEITRGFEQIPNVKSVVIADEWFPTDIEGESEGDWVLVFDPMDEGPEYWNQLNYRLDNFDWEDIDIDDINVDDIDISDIFR